MQGIDNREHRKLIEVFEKYKHTSIAVKETIEEDAKIYQNMDELDVLYHSFKVLLSELQRCTRDYELKKKTTRSIIHKNLRKLNAASEKK